MHISMTLSNVESGYGQLSSNVKALPLEENILLISC